MRLVKKNFLEKYDAFIFDMDGLLVDTERLSFEAWHEVSKAAGFHLTKEMFGTVVGTTAEESHRRLRSLLGEHFPAEEMRKKRTEIFDRRIETEGLPTMDGATDLVRAVKAAGKKTALATSTRGAFAAKRIEVAGLSGLFDITVTGDMVSKLKPAPDIYLKALELLQVVPDDAIAFEDSGLGVEAAHSARIDVVMVPNIYRPNTEDRKRAKVVLSSLTEMFET